MTTDAKPDGLRFADERSRGVFEYHGHDPKPCATSEGWSCDHSHCRKRGPHETQDACEAVCMEAINDSLADAEEESGDFSDGELRESMASDQRWLK